MTPRRRHAIIGVLGALAALGPFTIDMYLPGFSSIAADLHTTIATVGYSLTSYFVGISLGQLVYGPLTDRYGRRRPLLIGLAIYVAAAAACALSPTVPWLIAARFFMALGACSGIVASRAVARDLFPVKELAGVFSTFMLIIAASPMLAPTVGGYVAANLGWRMIFAVLTVLAVAIAVAVAVGLPESKTPDRRVSLRVSKLIRRYAEVTVNRQFLTFALASGFGFSSILAYVSGAPFLLMHLLGLSQTQFGWGFALNALGIIVSSQVNRRLLKSFSPQTITRAAVSVQVVLGAGLATIAFLRFTPMVLVFALMFSFLFATGLVNPNTTALSIEPFSDSAGSAAALVGFVQMGIGAIASALVSALANGTAVPMMMVIWASALLNFLLLRTLGRHHYPPRRTPVLQGQPRRK